jgi:methyltransferase OMS1
MSGKKVIIGISGLACFALPLYLSNVYFQSGSKPASRYGGDPRYRHLEQLRRSSSSPSSSPSSSSSSSSSVGGLREALPDAVSLFDKKASEYDASVSFDEKLVGITLMRRFLLKHSAGRTLEVAAGTFPNLDYYDPDRVFDLTLVDASEGMLEQGRAKLKAWVAENSRWELEKTALHQGSFASQHSVVHTGRMNAEELRFEDDSFDTVVDTFGLCSVGDPVKVVQGMWRVLKPGGKLLFLEHGRSDHWTFVSDILDSQHDTHYCKWGCHWNRDIPAVFEDAGVQADTFRTWHFGTTKYIVAQKPLS